MIGGLLRAHRELPEVQRGAVRVAHGPEKPNLAKVPLLPRANRLETCPPHRSPPAPNSRLPGPGRPLAGYPTTQRVDSRWPAVPRKRSPGAICIARPVTASMVIAPASRESSKAQTSPSRPLPSASRIGKEAGTRRSTEPLFMQPDVRTFADPVQRRRRRHFFRAAFWAAFRPSSSASWSSLSAGIPHLTTLKLGGTLCTSAFIGLPPCCVLQEWRAISAAARTSLTDPTIGCGHGQCCVLRYIWLGRGPQWNCPRCGAPAPEGHKFCGACGAPLIAPSQPAPSNSGERRQLTVMFCDLVGSTAIGARLDPEDFRDVVEAYHRCVTDCVTRLGGFTARYMGDGVLIYFGYPVANEDDAERAVRAGLAIVEAVPRLDTAAGPPSTLCARVGIATGLVIVGHLVGAGKSLEKAVVGDAPNLASRLQSLTEPGTVVIADSTRRLTRGLFDYRDIGSQAIKGYDQPVLIWRVLRESSIDSRFEALRAGAAPLFGRESELALVLRRWREVQRDGGRVVGTQWRSRDRQITPRCRAGGPPAQRAARQAALSLFTTSPRCVAPPSDRTDRPCSWVRARGRCRDKAAQARGNATLSHISRGISAACRPAVAADRLTGRDCTVHAAATQGTHLCSNPETARTADWRNSGVGNL